MNLAVNQAGPNLISLPVNSWEKNPATSAEVSSILGTAKGVLATLLCSKGVGYISQVIGGGRRLYETLERYGVRTVEELSASSSQALLKEVILPNLEEGQKFGIALEKQLKTGLIVPTIIKTEGPRWNQREYMDLWLHVLTEKVSTIYFCEGWQYGNGTVEEFCFAMHQVLGAGKRSDYKVLDAQGAALGFERGVALLGEMIEDLHQRGFTAPLHVSIAQRLANLWIEARPKVLEMQLGNEVSGINPEFCAAIDVMKADAVIAQIFRASSGKYKIDDGIWEKSVGAVPSYHATPTSRPVGQVLN